MHEGVTHGSVITASLSSDGSTLITSTNDGVLQVWSVYTHIHNNSKDGAFKFSLKSVLRGHKVSLSVHFFHSSIPFFVIADGGILNILNCRL